jgi:hypothetical protein
LGLICGVVEVYHEPDAFLSQGKRDRFTHTMGAPGNQGNPILKIHAVCLSTCSPAISNRDVGDSALQ